MTPRPTPPRWPGWTHVEQQRRRAGLRRSLTPRAAPWPPRWTPASNDYLGLARHPEVIEAGVARCAPGCRVDRLRLVTGNTELHEEFEAELADS